MYLYRFSCKNIQVIQKPHWYLFGGKGFIFYLLHDLCSFLMFGTNFIRCIFQIKKKIILRNAYSVINQVSFLDKDTQHRHKYIYCRKVVVKLEKNQVFLFFTFQISLFYNYFFQHFIYLLFSATTVRPLFLTYFIFFYAILLVISVI